MTRDQLLPAKSVLSASERRSGRRPTPWPSRPPWCGRSRRAHTCRHSRPRAGRWLMLDRGGLRSGAAQACIVAGLFALAFAAPVAAGAASVSTASLVTIEGHYRVIAVDGAHPGKET